MKTRITLHLDARKVRRARQLARARRISVSALIEMLIRTASSHGQDTEQPFSQCWAGKFHMASSSTDPLLNMLKARYDL